MRLDRDKLKQLREEKLLTVREMADLAGMSTNTVYRLEHGDIDARPGTVKKVARVLGVGPRELFARERSGAR
jgi:transcriptional regulator with XRE-family HTH domain